MALDPALISFASREAMAARLADAVEAALALGLCRDGAGRLAVSGGSTPKPLYEALARRELDWAKIAVTLVDERWVGADHPRSNEAFVRSAFAEAKGAKIAGLYNGAETPADAADDVAARLEPGSRPFDVVVLGMGNDGHTASWFPHAEGLETALDGDQTVCAIEARRSNVTGEETARMTLTLAALRDAGLIVLLLTGDEKRKTYEAALEDGPVEAMPVRAILRARPDLWACWAP